MSVIRVQCGQCKRVYSAPARMAGHVCRCLHCGFVLRVPGPDPGITAPPGRMMHVLPTPAERVDAPDLSQLVLDEPEASAQLPATYFEQHAQRPIAAFFERPMVALLDRVLPPLLLIGATAGGLAMAMHGRGGGFWPAVAFLLGAGAIIAGAMLGGQIALALMHAKASAPRPALRLAPAFSMVALFGQLPAFRDAVLGPGLDMGHLVGMIPAAAVLALLLRMRVDATGAAAVMGGLFALLGAVGVGMLWQFAAS